MADHKQTDLPIKVACPTCGAKPYQGCSRPWGPILGYHVRRVKAAAKVVPVHPVRRTVPNANRMRVTPVAEKLTEQEWEEVRRRQEDPIKWPGSPLLLRALAEVQAERDGLLKERDTASHFVMCEAHRSNKFMYSCVDCVNRALALQRSYRVEKEQAEAALTAARTERTDALATERAASERLREALKIFGIHASSCPEWAVTHRPKSLCNCGFDAALAAQPKTINHAFRGDGNECGFCLDAMLNSPAFDPVYCRRPRSEHPSLAAQPDAGVGEKGKAK